MKLGLKLWSTNENYIKPTVNLFEKELFDYIELFIVPECDYLLEKWQELKIPYILHAPHSLSGLNPAQKNCETRNFQHIEEIDEYRKALNPEFIIFHPGLDGELEETVRQFCKIRKKFLEIHKLMLVENKPGIGLNGESCIGSSSKEIQEIIERTGIGFCLDIGHAICAANSKDIKWYEFINDFRFLKPEMYHLSDGDISSEKDSHTNFEKGNFPLTRLLKLLPEDAKITIETEKASNNNLDDFENDVLYIINKLRDEK